MSTGADTPAPRAAASRTPTPELERLFDAAVALGSQAAQAGFLDQACPDPVLRREVESLLEAHRHPDSLFEEPTGTPRNAEPGEQPGRVVGRYRLLEWRCTTAAGH